MYFPRPFNRRNFLNGLPAAGRAYGQGIVVGVDPIFRSLNFQALLLVIHRPVWMKKLWIHSFQEVLPPHNFQRDNTFASHEMLDDFSPVGNVVVVRDAGRGYQYVAM